MKKAPTELPIIQKTYDLILWYVPHLNRLPRDHKFMLGNRLIEGLYELLDGLIWARYSTEKLARLESLNTLLDVIRYQTRLLKDFEMLDLRRYQFVSRRHMAIARTDFRFACVYERVKLWDKMPSCPTLIGWKTEGAEWFPSTIPRLLLFALSRVIT